MTEVLCAIASCTHWEDDHCRLSVLKIDGNAVTRDMNETCCASFAPRGEERANAGEAHRGERYR